MKKITKILSLLLCFITLSTVTACSKDDDEKNGPIADPASFIQGNYVGTGKLELVGLGVTAETYDGMKINVVKSSNEYVIVTPRFANDTPFFGSGDTGTVYKITQSANGDFMLTSSDYSRAQMTITKAGNMTYNYPYVTVGGESGYALTFQGNKQ